MSRPWPHEGYTAGRPLALAGLAAAVLLCSLVAPPGCGPKPTTQPADASATTQADGSPAGDPRSADNGTGLSRVPGKIYLVQQGDTLYSLAERYYGHSKFWRKIWTANRNRLTNPNDLPVGMKLIIPP
jgi:nucleoid-associated protein YgaU